MVTRAIGARADEHDAPVLLGSRLEPVQSDAVRAQLPE
jgi:hypothetical protein